MKNMKKGLVALLAGSIALAGLPNLAFSGETSDTSKSKASASHQIGLSILPWIKLEVDEFGKIIGLYTFGNVPDEDVSVWRGNSRIPMTDQIREEYEALKQDSRIDWNNRHIVHYEFTSTGLKYFGPSPEVLALEASRNYEAGKVDTTTGTDEAGNEVTYFTVGLE